MAIKPTATPRPAKTLPELGDLDPRIVAAFQRLVDDASATSAGGLAIKTGIETVASGSSLSVVSGLTEIQFALTSIKDATQGAGAGAYATYDHGADGLLDLFAWDDAGVAATVDTDVCWLVLGTA